ncbi:MAG: histidinol-phosphate transaminase [Bdellovibrionales bacterium]|nr:histidinol-phosphate transaminase [Bdellovibrionales bacterium]
MESKTMNLVVPDYIRSIIPYVPGKPIGETQRELGIRKVVKLASNENPLGPSPRAAAAVRKALKDLHRYPDASAYELKLAINRHLGIDPGRIVTGNGSNDVIDLLVRAFCQPGDAIVTSQAAFIAYRICAQIQGVRSLEAPLTPDMRFDLGAIAELVRRDPKARMVFVANPNNPTGTYSSREELRSFLKEMTQIRGGSVLTVLDYAYWEYVTAADLPDPAELLKEFPQVVVLRTFSKIYGLAGLRVGYGVAAPEVIATLDKIRQPFNLNVIALAAGAAALSDKAFVKRAREANIQGMAFWEKGLERLSVPYLPSQGNFLLADVRRGMGKRGSDVYVACLKKGAIFRPVANYGLDGWLRISIGTAAENRFALEVLTAESGRNVKAGRSPRKGSIR